MTVAFIDDDRSTNFYHQIILEEYLTDKKSIECKFFDSATDALEELRTLGTQHQPELIFLDLNMPMVNGWEFLDKYFALDLPHSETVILTTSSDPRDQQRARQYKIVKAYKEKPISEEILEEFIGHLVNS